MEVRGKEKRGAKVNNKEIKNLIKKARKLAKPFRVTDDTFRLKDIDRDKSTEASVASMSEVVSDLSQELPLPFAP